MIAIIGLEERRGTDRALARERARLSRSGQHAAAMALETQVHRKPWVAEVVGIIEATGQFERRYLPFKRDYLDATASGNHGVKLYFVLRNGHYEVREVLSMTRERRYFVQVDQGRIEEVSRSAVVQALTATREAVQSWLRKTVSGT